MAEQILPRDLDPIPGGTVAVDSAIIVDDDEGVWRATPDEVVEAVLSVDTGAAKVGIKRAGTGAVSETVEDELGRLPVYPESFGCAGDGVTNDTVNFNKAVVAAGVGGVIDCTPGATYMIDGALSPTHIVFGGVKLLTGQTLNLNGATLKQIPTASPGYSVVSCFEISNWKIVGPGRIEGDRDEHIGVENEQGRCITVSGGDNWYIGQAIELTNSWGDGLYLGFGYSGDDPEADDPTTDFLVEGLHIWNCRRNGISVVGAKRGVILLQYIHDIDGVAPRAAIDLEPDGASYPNEDVRIVRLTAHDCDYGVIFTAGGKRNSLTGSTVYDVKVGIEIGASQEGIQILDNPRIEATASNAGNTALRAISGTALVKDIMIRGNVFIGAGSVVVDTVSGHGQINFLDNDIRATLAGTTLPVRILGAGTFFRSKVTVGALAGAADSSFLTLSANVISGASQFYNDSAFTMFSSISGVTIAQDDYVTSTLKRGSIGGTTGLVVTYGSDNISVPDHFRVAGAQVVEARKTGWTPATGTATRTTFATYAAPDISATYDEAQVQALADHAQILSQRLKALIDDLHITAGHGLIGT